jgi:DNA-binding NarL/FixJ family response regulator
LAATLHGRDGVVVTDAVDLGPHGITKIADAEPDVVLVDLGRTDPVAAARLIKAASPESKLVAFGLDEIDDHVFACAAAGSKAEATSCIAPCWTRRKVAYTARPTSSRR